MRTNVLRQEPRVFTHEGAAGVAFGPEAELRRAVAACMLWEDQFYESGEDIAVRISKLVPLCRPEYVAACAYEARTKQKLRHVPLLLVAAMAGVPGHKAMVGRLLPDVIQRADELSEFVAIYAKVNGVTPDKVKRKLSAQVKLGLARAFRKFDEYALAKYNGGTPAVRLRDVLFMVHPKPVDAAQDELWKRLVAGTLATPDTWEVAHSALGEATAEATAEEKAGAKRAEWERMLTEGKLGALAFLRNMRNMQEAGVDTTLVQAYAEVADTSRVLPFRFLTAARAVPAWEHYIEPMMLRACEGRPKLPGRTCVLVDVSGSMDAKVAGKSDVLRVDAAAGVAILLRELCEDVVVAKFGSHTEQLPPRRGFALRDAIGKAEGGTDLGGAVAWANAQPGVGRLIVLTDEQSNSPVGAARAPLAYMVNLASAQHGVGYGPWCRVNGWSEAVIDYIQAFEDQQAQASQ